MNLRTLDNVPGVSFDDTKLDTLFAEDYNEVAERILGRIVSITNSSTPTPNADVTDQYHVTALSGSATFGAPTGTILDGQKLVVRIKDNGTARALAWNSVYRASTDLALPTTTVLSKTLYLLFVYNYADTKWDLLALMNNF